jgi:hypothetical protein
MGKDIIAIISNYYEKIIRECMLYVDNSIQVETIYIYSSLEDNWWLFFNVFYKIKGEILKKHQLNKVFSEYQVADMKQSHLNKICQAELKEMKFAISSNQIKVPTEIRVIFHPQIKECKYLLKYEKQLVNDLSFHEITDKWFAELKKGYDVVP